MILVNGKEAVAIQAMDRGLAYGDGVFRTLAARNGAPQHWSRHYAKLAHDCAALSISCPEQHVLQSEVRFASESGRNCAVKIIITRGTGDRGYSYAPESAPTRIVIAGPLPQYAQDYAKAGVKLRLCNLKLAHQPALAGIKHLNRLESVIARAEWSDPEIAEGLLCDGEGNVIGGTMTNVFVARSDALATPRLDRCGVAGVTRDRVIDAAARHGIACHATNISWSDLLGAEEIFVVNSLSGVWPVRDIEGRARSPGPIARSLQQWLEQEDDAQVA